MLGRLQSLLSGYRLSSNFNDKKDHLMRTIVFIALVYYLANAKKVYCAFFWKVLP